MNTKGNVPQTDRNSDDSFTEPVLPYTTVARYPEDDGLGYEERLIIVDGVEIGGTSLARAGAPSKGYRDEDRWEPSENDQWKSWGPAGSLGQGMGFSLRKTAEHYQIAEYAALLTPGQEILPPLDRDAYRFMILTEASDRVDLGAAPPAETVTYGPGDFIVRSGPRFAVHVGGEVLGTVYCLETEKGTVRWNWVTPDAMGTPEDDQPTMRLAAKALYEHAITGAEPTAVYVVMQAGLAGVWVLQDEVAFHSLAAAQDGVTRIADGTETWDEEGKTAWARPGGRPIRWRIVALTLTAAN